MKRTMIALLVLIFLSSCSANAATPTVTPAPLPSSTPLPTQTPAPTETPTPEPTATPEILASTTEAFVPIEITLDPDHAPTITMEDVTSGRLAQSERLVALPFPDGAFMSGWKKSNLVSQQVKDVG